MTFAKVIGSVLRAVRRERGLTLRQAGTASRGRFPPTSLASYERGERSISLERFCHLAGVYRVAPDRLVAEIMRTIEGRPPTKLDRARLGELDSPQARRVSDFVDAITELRHQPATDVVTLRLGDLEVLAPSAGCRLEEFIESIAPAITATADADDRSEEYLLSGR